MFDECRTEGDFTLSSGRKSTYFYDFDLLLPKETARYSEMLLQLLPTDIKKRTDFVAAPALGGIIPGFLVAFAMDKPLIIVDKENKIRGPDFRVGNYIIVDDVSTSFHQANRVRDALGSKDCLAIVSYIFRGNMTDLTKQDVPVYYLERKEEEE